MIRILTFSRSPPSSSPRADLPKLARHNNNFSRSIISSSSQWIPRQRAWCLVRVTVSWRRCFYPDVLTSMDRVRMISCLKGLKMVVACCLQSVKWAYRTYLRSTTSALFIKAWRRMLLTARTPSSVTGRLTVAVDVRTSLSLTVTSTVRSKILAICVEFRINACFSLK